MVWVEAPSEWQTRFDEGDGRGVFVLSMCFGLPAPRPAKAVFPEGRQRAAQVRKTGLKGQPTSRVALIRGLTGPDPVGRSKQVPCVSSLAPRDSSGGAGLSQGQTTRRDSVKATFQPSPATLRGPAGQEGLAGSRSPATFEVDAGRKKGDGGGWRRCRNRRVLGQGTVISSEGTGGGEGDSPLTRARPCYDEVVERNPHGGWTVPRRFDFYLNWVQILFRTR